MLQNNSIQYHEDFLASKYKPRRPDDKPIYFRSELNAQLWLKASLELDSIVSEYAVKVNNTSIRYDIIFADLINKRSKTLRVLELKPEQVNLEMISQKMARHYFQALPLTFGNNKDYEIIFVGSSITLDAELFLESMQNMKLYYPTRKGIMKLVVPKYMTYEEILQDYFRRYQITSKQAKVMRNTYSLLSGHSDPLPWID